MFRHALRDGELAGSKDSFRTLRRPQFADAGADLLIMGAFACQLLPGYTRVCDACGPERLPMANTGGNEVPAAQNLHLSVRGSAALGQVVE